MRLLLSLAAVLGIVVAGFSFGLTHSRVAQAETLSIDLVGTGAEENPAISSPGSALARFTLDTDTNELTYAVTISGLSQTQITAAHIHRAGAGTNGPVVHTLSAVPFTTTSGSIALSADDVSDLAAGNFYLNVHSLTDPGGFARAQIIFPGLAAPSDSGGTVTPPSTGDAGLAAGTASNRWMAVAGLATFGLAMGFILARRRA